MFFVFFYVILQIITVFDVYKCVLVETHVRLSPFKCLLISRLLATEKKEMY